MTRTKPHPWTTARYWANPSLFGLFVAVTVTMTATVLLCAPIFLLGHKLLQLLGLA